MTISTRETFLFWITGMVALFGLTYLVCDPKIKEWGTVGQKQTEVRRSIGMAERLVAQGPQWDQRLAELRKKLPQYPADKDVTADLLIKLEQIASAHGLTLSSRDAEKETQRGDMYELAVNCKWEGKLEAVVHFLFDLQKEDAILDASQLTITPNEKKIPKGSFTVYCSYSRAQPAGAPRAPEAKPADRK
jgi:Tfp pilus assembly protein PilO